VGGQKSSKCASILGLLGSDKANQAKEERHFE